MINFEVRHVATSFGGPRAAVAALDFGHTDPMFVLPYGVLAQIDCDNQRFEILENAVVD